MQASRLNMVLLVGLLGVGAVTARSASFNLTLEEQSVINALLTQDGETKEWKKHVVAEMTLAQPPLAYQKYDDFAADLRRDAGNQRDQPFREAVEDFITKNRSPIQFGIVSNTLTSIQLVSSAVLNEIFSAKRNDKPNGWEVFHKRFSDAPVLITLSRPGFDSERSVALVFLCVQQGYTAGTDSIRVLRRQSGKWVITHEHIGPRGVF